MPVRAVVVSDADKAFGREFTNLSAKQADKLRIRLNANRKLNALDGKNRPHMLPKDPAHKVRLYFAEVEGNPVPAEFLELVGKSATMPDATAGALKLATQYGIDLRDIQGTGEAGEIRVADVRAKLREIVDNIEREEGQGAIDEGASEVPAGND